MRIIAYLSLFSLFALTLATLACLSVPLAFNIGWPGVLSTLYLLVFLLAAIAAAASAYFLGRSKHLYSCLAALTAQIIGLSLLRIASHWIQL